jgi:hypothetical protein
MPVTYPFGKLKSISKNSPSRSLKKRSPVGPMRIITTHTIIRDGRVMHDNLRMIDNG